jgi:hypothetical protein
MSAHTYPPPTGASGSNPPSFHSMQSENATLPASEAPSPGASPASPLPRYSSNPSLVSLFIWSALFATARAGISRSSSLFSRDMADILFGLACERRSSNVFPQSQTPIHLRRLQLKACGRQLGGCSCPARKRIRFSCVASCFLSNLHSS